MRTKSGLRTSVRLPGYVNDQLVLSVKVLRNL